jgi:hypothetical protein
MRTYVGIDIGKSGAIVAIYPDGSIEKHTTPKMGKEIDGGRFSDLINDIWNRSEEVVIAIEDVHSIFGTGAKSNFEFGRSLGIVEGVLQALRVNWYKVAPKTWQKIALLGVQKVKKLASNSNDTKAMALVAARRLYPKQDLRKSERAEKPDNGIVDALLIAHYAKVTYTKAN